MTNYLRNGPLGRKERSLLRIEIGASSYLFSIQVSRLISKDLLVRHKKMIYKMNEPNQVRRLRRAPVLVCENMTGEVTIYHQDKVLNYEVYRPKLHADQLLKRAGINNYLDKVLEQEKCWRPTRVTTSPQAA